MSYQRYVLSTVRCLTLSGPQDMKTVRHTGWGQ